MNENGAADAKPQFEDLFFYLLVGIFAIMVALMAPYMLRYKSIHEFPKRVRVRLALTASPLGHGFLIIAMEASELHLKGPQFP
ncbi:MULTISPECIES: hypothetical protein [Rhizobium]|uniref:hypothetical protein n=1 Tax=Rhizobium TaxID=379 RepID=UPI0003725FA1|nr:hypothetical protein [Rhizobium ruizarguesonis]MBY5891689.1 hypothetical protein [Rhizobium leguminosarum]QSZ05094.1 hypothetical protein J3P73_34275 [Rhizobium ruizarguesonis]TAZ86968.1 hypothetical protein ELH67_33315 [Rhizobium ruizarguesonis]TBA31956.1 hypothetical protein ELH60_25890 [Rhizobium ruizarguesonis]TBA50966.1 hypothetical protein ELH59_32015 [Rhizobium ruizarguesonis]